MPKFFRLNQKNRDKLFLELKSKEKISWLEIANKLCISRAMLFNYKSGRYPKFFEEIKPANKKHLKRYEIYSSLRR